MTLTERRRAKGVPLGEMARRVGLETGPLSRIERGSATPSPEVKAALAKELGCNEQDLVGALPTKEEVDQRERPPVGRMHVPRVCEVDAMIYGPHDNIDDVDAWRKRLDYRDLALEKERARVRLLEALLVMACFVAGVALAIATTG